MNEALLILYLAGTGMTAQPVRVEYPTMEKCRQMAERERARGHMARCLSLGSEIRICANCGAPVRSLG